MVPIQIRLQNFLSYRQATKLDLRGIHLACISGANGSGKSSLLDAMTWALFGQSRSKSDDDLVNRAAAGKGEAAEVRLLFALEASTYRIVRRKQISKPQSLELQLQVDTDEWRSLTEGGVRNTQAAIEKLLGMNYDTFVNASFLLQGRADEFTTKTPNNRKEILADLLGLSNWDRYRALANEERRQAEGQLQLIEGRLRDIELELEKEPQRLAELETATSSLDAISARLDGQEELLKQGRRAAAAIERQKQVVDNLSERLGREQAELKQLEQRRSERLERQKELAATISDAEDIEAGFAKWQKLQEELEALQDQYQRYSTVVAERRPHELALQDQRSRLEQRRQELERRRRRISGLEEEREQKEAALTETLERLEASAGRLKALKEREQAYHAADKQLQSLRADRRYLERQAEQLRQRKQEVAALQKEKTRLSAALVEVDAGLARAQLSLTEVEPQVEELTGARAEMEALTREQPRLKEEMNDLQERISLLKEASTCPMCGQSLTAAHRQEVLAELQQDGRQRGDRYRDNRDRLAELEQRVTELRRAPAEKQHLTGERLRLQQRQASLTAQLGETEKHIEHWQEEEKARLEALEEQLADDATMKQAEQEVTELEAEIAAVAALEEQHGVLERRVADLEARLSAIAAELQEWHDEETGLAAELDSIVAKLETEDFAPEARQALAALTEKANAVDYDPAAHQAARRQLEALGNVRQRHAALDRARAALEPLEDTLADLADQQAAATQRIREITEQLEEAQDFLQKLEEGGVDVAAIEAEVNQLREEQIVAHRRVATAQQSVAVLADLRALKRKEQGQAAAQSRRIQRLRLLEKACSREGVQALLIERALPEIEEDANDLLERLTSGQMRVTFETQRRLKTRDHLAETLDIRITDNQGERPYENYSGGEQFRVNFAIRLALSRILAKRAGARLETLVIDEGFGSQDPNGRQRLVEAINTVQGDFQRILVITHIDELRDAFPTRIEVTKSPKGSLLTVI
ncbi:MAG: SMC family ATPase [Candidatus Promineifilaceae bacterium]|nr:SMC family ATPase [Candidatus Promineifilaceae bacterium]